MTKENKQRPLSVEEFFKIATMEQKELLSNIYNNIQEEVELTKKIDNIYKCIDQGIYTNDKGITICESEDDANVISLKLKDDLKIVRERIGKLLKKAADELDMGNVGIIQRLYGNYVGELT